MSFDDPDQIVGLELVKGIVFVLVSGGLLYLLITRHARRILDSEVASIERLKQSEQRFRTLVEGIHDHLIVLLNRRGEIITWNPGAETLTGFTGKEVIGKHFRMLFDDRDQASGQPETQLAEASERGPVTTFGRHLRADGSSFEVRSTIAPVYDDDGEVAGFTKITRDLTEALEKSRALENLSAQLIDAQESERERIARELHDEFGGIFTSLSFDAALIGENATHPALVGERSSEMIRQIELAMKRVREIAQELRPKVLDDFGLVAAIEDLVASFSDRFGIETNLSCRPEEITVGKGHDIMLYRIVQEALTNVAKHSAATRAEVRLRLSDHHVIAEIRDDGRGIRPEEINAGGSLGLVGMRERADILGGDLAIEPFEGRGTIVRVTVPLSRKERS